MAASSPAMRAISTPVDDVLGFAQRHNKQVRALGKVRMGKGCLYVSRQADVDLDVLAVLIERSVRVRRRVDRAPADG